MTMRTCVNTARTVGVALGVFALALLPNPARAQAGDVEAARQLEKARAELAALQDAKRAQADLEQARAELAKLKADIAARQEQIKALEAKIAAMQGGKGGDPAKDRVIIVRDPRAEEKNPTEIVLILRKVGDGWEVKQLPAKKADAKLPDRQLFRVEEKDGVLRIVPVEPGKAPPGETPRFVPVEPGTRPGVPGTKVPPPAAPADARIENLERQLKRVMDELEALRKEMKGQPRPGGGREESSNRFELRLGDLHKGVPPGAKVEEKDGVRYFTIPLDQVKPAPKPEPNPVPAPPAPERK
jgi:hypothetical protein